MKKYKITVELLSQALIGSGEGFGAVIDTDIVFDDSGIPWVPSKRIKGCLRDSATEVCEILGSSGINYIPLDKEIRHKENNDKKDQSEFKIVNELFGTSGSDEPSPLYISNLNVQGYEELKEWIGYLRQSYPLIINPEAIRKTYTQIRQQTSIDENGTAKEHSLRTLRVARKGLVFEGEIELEEEREEFVRLLYLACLNLRRFGTKRNRGFGEIKCRLLENGNEINLIKELEAVA